MKTNGILVLFMMLVIVLGCNNTSNKKNIENDRKEIVKLEKELFGDDAKEADEEKALKLTKLYNDFAENYPKDSLAPDYLYKSAEIVSNIGDPGKAIVNYDIIIKEYPGYKKVPYCYFMKGFVYDNKLKDIEKAEKAYTQFIEKYPNHDLTDDAEMSIKFLGKSNEEIIKEFEKNQEKETQE
jgi:outer membrane protein assembly factor BamD (BamD/ComL family)